MANDKRVTISPTVLSALVSRATLAQKLGYQYSGERDVYEALGYPDSITYEMYATQYERQDIAKAIIDRPVQSTWQGGFELIESSDDEETELESQFRALMKRLKLAIRFAQFDKLVSLGHYGCLFIGFDDVENKYGQKQPVVVGQNREVLFIRPLAEDVATVATWENDSSNERYGLPVLYNLTLETSSGNTDTMLVHHSRIIHAAGDTINSDVEGIPALQAVFNRLKDLEKLVGGSAEMFWRGARPGYQAEIDPNYNMTSAVQDDLQDQLDEFEHNLRRILAVEGAKFSPLQMQVADPDKHVDVQIQMISAITGIPKRILTGSERGELASTEDKSTWLDLIQSRRLAYAEIQIVRPFIDRCIEVGALPAVADDDYEIKWPDLYAMSEKDQVDIGKVRASALREYASTPEAQAVLGRKAFLKYGLRFSDDEIELIDEMDDAEQQMMAEEDARLRAEDQAAEEERIAREEEAAAEEARRLAEEEARALAEEQAALGEEI